MSSSGKSENAGQAPAVFPPHQVRRRVRGGFFKALKRTFRHRILLGLFCLVSLGAGYLAGKTLGTSYWVAKLDFIVQGQVDPHHAKAFQALVTHQSTLVQGLKKIETAYTNRQMDLPFTKRQLERALSVDVKFTPGLMSVHLKSIDPDVAKALLSAASEAFQSYQEEGLKQRRASSDNNTAAQLAKLQEEINQLRQAKQELVAKDGGSDLGSQMASIREVIGLLETGLRDDRAKEVTAKEQYRELLRQLDDLKKTAARELEYDEMAMVDSVGDNRRRQQRIFDLVRDEKEHIESTASLEAKLKEKKEREDLIKNGKGTLAGLAAQAFAPADIIRLDSEIHVLKAKLQGNRKIDELENEIRKIDKLIVPRKGKTMPTSPIITQMLDKKMDRELVMLGLAKEIDHIQQELESQKTKLAHLQSLEGKSSDLDKKIAELEKERAALQAQSTRAEQSTFSITPLGEPTTDAFADSSNRPTIFTTIFLSGSGLSILAVLLYELVMGIRLPSDVARSLRIPVRFIAASPAYAAADYRDLCRLVRNHGFLAKTTLQIQPLNQDAATRTKTCQAAEGLAAAFSQRGEKVLIVDLGQTAQETNGLTELLRNPEDSLDRYVHVGANDSIARMIAGREALTTAQLTDPAMRAFLEKTAATYPVILIQGMGLQGVQQVEALGLASHGLLMVSDGNRKIEPIAREALLDLTAEYLAPRALIIV